MALFRTRSRSRQTSGHHLRTAAPTSGSTATRCLTVRPSSADLVRTSSLALVLWGGLLNTNSRAVAQADSFAPMRDEYTAQIKPLLQDFCLDCHAADIQDGDLDLERFASFDDVRSEPAAWQKVAEFLGNGEMPPADAEQPAPEQRQRLRAWVAAYLKAEALANAGDPGPVVLRRLNNAEYTYTLQDLTGVPLTPAREFPADGAAGEGFTNAGGALVMSPALAEKYLASARQIAEHAVLLPDGVAFSERTTRSDWTNERMYEIRRIYSRHTTGNQDVSALDRWAVPNALSATDEDGRIDLLPYWEALIAHRDDVLRDPAGSAARIAGSSGLNAKYLGLLIAALTDEDESSILLHSLRQRWRSATPDDAAAIVAEIDGWQRALWKFNVVGHFGMIRPWQEPVTPLMAEREFRLKLDAPAQGDIVLHLAANAGDAATAHRIEWRNARFERPGSRPIRLQDVRGGTAALEQLRAAAIVQTETYLTAAFQARIASGTSDVEALAAANDVDAHLLHAWLDYLGIGTGGEAVFGELLSRPTPAVGGHDFLHAWDSPDLADLSLIANSSDQTVNIPGEMRPHSVCVHPRPERWIGAGWRSPVAGSVRIEALVRDAHPGCGNGVSWSVELRRGRQRRVLRSGNNNVGATADIPPVEQLRIEVGDIVALVIGPRDGNHFCDLTQVDLRINELEGDQQAWSLAGDCADSLAAGNPHADRHGHDAVWHFAAGLLADQPTPRAVPEDSLLARWLETIDVAEAAQLARQTAQLLRDPPSNATPAADRELRSQLLDLAGPLFGQLDFAALAESARTQGQQDSPYGVASDRFTAARHLSLDAPGSFELRLPASLFAGSEFVVTAALPEDSAGTAIVQPQVGFAPPDTAGFSPGAPLLTRNDSPAAAQVERSFHEFRQLFPMALCYARIVPVDETVTLVLFHREDEHVARLMLSDDEAARLDSLWSELRYVSQAALRSEVGLEQLLEFATQDADPRVFEPVKQPIADEANELRRQMLAAEPQHVEAVIELAGHAFRRPLTGEQREALREFYAGLRADGTAHEDAVRYLIARVFTSPAFLYRTEQARPGTERTPLDDWELATRLSYFLWSTAPDDSLLSAAERGELADSARLSDHARRMLTDDRAGRLAVEFACQWLHIRDFDQHDEKSAEFFPEFADLRDDMYQESVLFFTDLIQQDRSILGILNADYTFLNGTLAAHYGIEGVDGDEWRRVEGLGDQQRGGILTQATFLAAQSGASRTSPILRGNWVSETLLNERLPRPPKDVPQLPETPPAGLSERELIEQHSSVEACAKCHARIDPYGFALENFDAIGRWRDRDANGHAINTQTALRDGTPLEGVAGLRDYLLTTRRDDFIRQFCRKLLGYALGRSVQLSDDPLLDAMQRNLEENDYRFSAAVETIVLSDQFRMLRGADDPRSNIALDPGGESADGN